MELRVVVLDDDPTGIQTVHGCLLLTKWDKGLLERAMRDRENFFYILEYYPFSIPSLRPSMKNFLKIKKSIKTGMIERIIAAPTLPMAIV